MGQTTSDLSNIPGITNALVQDYDIYPGYTDCWDDKICDTHIYHRRAVIDDRYPNMGAAQSDYRKNFSKLYDEYNLYLINPPPGTDIKWGPTSVWGPAKWMQLHLMAVSFPDMPTDVDRRDFQVDLMTFISTLPCQECRGHATEYVKTHPLQMFGNAAMQTWVFDFHNAVNARLGKPVFTNQMYMKKYPFGTLL